VTRWFDINHEEYEGFTKGKKIEEDEPGDGIKRFVPCLPHYLRLAFVLFARLLCLWLRFPAQGSSWLAKTSDREGHMRIRKGSVIFWLTCLVFLAGCPAKSPESPQQQAPESPILERVPAARLPDLVDDEPAGTLRTAIMTSLAWYGRISEDKLIPFGNHTIPAKALKNSLGCFLELLDSGHIDPQTLSREFDIFLVVPPDRAGRMLVTGYYEPVLEGSLKPGGQFKWPLYGIPADLVTIELDRFDPVRFHGERLVGRLEKNRMVPFYTRSEIEGKKKLERSGAQLVWLKDPVDSFFLHIQGSGMIKLPDGRTLRVGYAGSNGRPYRSIGKTLIEKGAISSDEMSMQAIRNYLHAHPECREEIMWENESYVFFRLVSEGPLGSLDSVLTAGRSIASDPKVHPRGALAFLVSEKPRYDSAGQVAGWDRMGRWVLNQDTGGAIKGPARIDLFCGTGNMAESIAGPMKQPGELYYFIKKGFIPQDW
jgi:membrane-bound lytic murein transglycosylase A